MSVNGQLQYTVNNLNMPFADTQKNFSGNFQSKIFAGADVITGSNGQDNLSGFGGADSMFGRGSNDTIHGNNGADNINGGANNDKIFGDKGNDTLDGGTGADSLTGGTGKDAFLFDNQLNGTNLDAIADFAIGKDVIQLAASSFPGIGAKGALPGKAFVLSSAYHGQDDVVVYFKGSGKLAYEVNGGNLNDAIQFATVTKGLALSASDFLIV